jgi:hypothetical protein
MCVPSIVMSFRTGGSSRKRSAQHTIASTTRTPFPTHYNNQHTQKEEEMQKRTRYVVTANKITSPSKGGDEDHDDTSDGQRSRDEACRLEHLYLRTHTHETVRNRRTCYKSDLRSRRAIRLLRRQQSFSQFAIQSSSRQTST